MLAAWWHYYSTALCALLGYLPTQSPPVPPCPPSTQSIRTQAPKIGGSFAVWGGLFSSFDCTLVALRKKEDPWNSIAAGALTGGFLQLRTGLHSAAKSAVFGGVLLVRQDRGVFARGCEGVGGGFWEALGGVWAA